jgi:spore coat polysaccharide biosynthesis protein SpsF
MFVIIIQARMGSTRLPGKILKKLLDKEIIFWSYDRSIKSIANDVIISTSINKENDILEEKLMEKKIKYFRGSENDLLDRYYQTLQTFYPDNSNINIIRITSDCPFVDPNIINNMINYFQENNYDYIVNHSLNAITPEGSGIEIINLKSLKYLWENEQSSEFREHATGMLRLVKTHDNIIKKGVYEYSPENILESMKFIKISIDTEKDYLLSEEIANNFQNYDFSYDQVLLYLQNKK